MSDSRKKRETKSITPEAFALLLSKLEEDQEIAGEKYLLLYLRLTTFFSVRRCPIAEELADETLNRVAIKIAAGEEPQNLPAYCYGFARHVWHEYLKRPDINRADFDELPPTEYPVEEIIDLKKQTSQFIKCLSKLPSEESQIFIEYWHHEDQDNIAARKNIAKRLGISPTALRIRIFRIKNKLEECMKKMMNKK